MRAVAMSRFGGPEVLEVADLPVREPGPGQVRIRVAAAAVNPTDALFRAGAHAQALSAFPPPYVPGMDAAGVVDAVGPDTDWEVGDRVMAIVVPAPPEGGAQQEQVVVPADSVARVPDGVTLEEAATLPMNGLTARLALDLLDLPSGGTLAVTGAAGAVGGYAVALAAHAGLRVIADAKESDEELVRGFGASVVVPRGPEVAGAIRAAAPDGVDGLIDAALLGEAVLPAVRDGGGVAHVRPTPLEPVRDLRFHRVMVAEYARNRAALEELARLAADKVLALRVAETFPPERAADAHRALEAGGVRGRLLIVF
ncbi:NADP-dependent oxidoreductase [Allostreptomyces psammosilenae]|uniref:NADPH:quinone reductase-like Zn-dependent oxidoreductase n=1 Tax=Allostreptomyces psammosilenae TaxID=1892865 RepID=A0A852ZZX0_9ACTN|nr:NADP-dependent oxidoreductase [Allostreptomyces psammosilenae]NYI03678.1 NADPH:quinone reductase-like Zn-dependent oxidoreductase [Allostreptomyces psammosilenae]